MNAFSLSPLAESDLDHIWSYFAEFDADNADRFLIKILEVLQMLADNPLSGRQRSEIRENLRFFPKDDYCIFYYPNPLGVRIMRILHSSRDIENIINEELLS